MQDLEKEIYWKLELHKLCNLTFAWFAVHVNFANDMTLNQNSYCCYESIKKDLNQELTDDLINDLLVSEDYKSERIEQAVWLLVMKNVLPEGNYLISIDW